MAYGLRSSELAAVGKNVNKQGHGVSEESIQAALDQELAQERKEAVSKHKERTSDAKSADAAQKAQLKSNMIKAVVDSGIKAASFAAERSAESPKAQAKQAARQETRMTKRADRLGAKQAKFTSKLPESGTTDRQLKKLGRMGQRTKGAQTKAIQQGVKAQRLQDKYEVGKMYKKSGALYGTKRPTSETLLSEEELGRKLFGGSGS